MEIIVKDNYDEMSVTAARVVASVINEKPNAVLGFPAGKTPLGMYRELVRMHKDEGLDFSYVTTFNLDEFVGLDKFHPQSHQYCMHENFFKQINIRPENTYIPSGTTDNHRAFCKWYEQCIKNCGGIDLQVLGIGIDGHIGGNEPGSSLGSRTRIKTLSKKTIEGNKSNFDDLVEEVPIFSITMGVGTILESRQILLIANGKVKASPVAASIEGAVTGMVAGSALQLHKDAIFILDQDAASKLERLEYYKWVQENLPTVP